MRSQGLRIDQGIEQDCTSHIDHGDLDQVAIEVGGFGVEDHGRRVIQPALCHTLELREPRLFPADCTEPPIETACIDLLALPTGALGELGLGERGLLGRVGWRLGCASWRS